ncbi:MAG: mobilization protein [Bacillota bacterium]
MPKKRVDSKNRVRSKTVGFRVSPEEWAEIERLVRISGMSKQEYIMHRLRGEEITVVANPRVVKAIREEVKLLEDQYDITIKVQ